MTPNQSPLRIACLLFGSGMCALVYQTVWLREFRLIFGASTAASAAVLGIFMGGLGLGSALLGKRAEAHRRPLEYYARLEILISISAALTPLIFGLVRMAYTATGGSPVLGHTGATIARLVLAGVVLAIPTFLMGGTLPAAARAAESDDDEGRRRLALLYGCNTLGAVAGATLSTFVLIENLGNRQTLWLACGLNLLVAMLARVMARSMPETVASGRSEAVLKQDAVVPWKFAMIASAGVGWAFMLMELVWYRMLSPILGGSTFTFGLILAVALLGIGLGGGLYALLRSNVRPSANGFATTCGIEALFIAIPFGLGDRLATLAMQLRGLSVFGFEGHLFGWAIVTAIVVLPAAIVAGYQFPMLIALLGRGGEGVGRQTGLTYAANTAGAIVGSLGGGFGLMPLLSAPGAWKLVVISLVALAAAAVVVGHIQKESRSWIGVLAGATAVALLFCMGPTAAWRHSGIGAGRSSVRSADQNAVRNFQNMYRGQTVWEADGVESSVALVAGEGYAFVVNGKVDGNSRGDAGTQVMSGMLGALMHPHPKRAMVIGLGTGSTAGWLAAIPSMERVDVVELEEVILHVADKCSPVNQDVLKNPKVHIHIGDAREALLTGREKYDVIFSEPSNPYRAGIASLFSQDFYTAVQHRLTEGGVFLQWTQLYDVDAEAIHTVFATVGTVFPHVQTWHTQGKDIVLLATKQPIVLDVNRLRERIKEEPYRSALLNAWRADSLEGVLSHYLIGDGLAKLCIDSGAEISTDDRSPLEFGFARGVGRGAIGDWDSQIAKLARQKGWHRPKTTNGEVNWEQVDEQYLSQRAVFALPTPAAITPGKQLEQRRSWINAYLANDRKGALAIWKEARFAPLNPMESQILATLLAEESSPDAGAYIAKLREVRPTDADAIQAGIFVREKKWDEAVALLEGVFRTWRTDPWADEQLSTETLRAATVVVRNSGDPKFAQRIFAAVKEPFSAGCQDAYRRRVALMAAQAIGDQTYRPVVEILNEYEPNVPWQREILQLRAKAYQVAKDPRLSLALEELNEFDRNVSPAFERSLGALARSEATVPSDIPRSGGEEKVTNQGEGPGTGDSLGVAPRGEAPESGG